MNILNVQRGYLEYIGSAIFEAQDWEIVHDLRYITLKFLFSEISMVINKFIGFRGV